jgi:hypothetical protein
MDDLSVTAFVMFFMPTSVICRGTVLTFIMINDLALKNNLYRKRSRISSEYIFYCKRAILFLSSSEILTPHPPLRPASVYAFVAGGGQTRRAERGMGGQYFGRREK